MSQREQNSREQDPEDLEAMSRQSTNESDKPEPPVTSFSPLDFPYRMLGSGMELASYTLILGAVGYWIDGHWEHPEPYFAITGALVGFTLGMYRLIALATRQR